MNDIVLPNFRHVALVRNTPLVYAFSKSCKIILTNKIIIGIGIEDTVTRIKRVPSSTYVMVEHLEVDLLFK